MYFVKWQAKKQIFIKTSDEEVIPARQAKMQVKMASRDAKHWQKKYELSQQEARLLRKRIAHIEATVESRLFSRKYLSYMSIHTPLHCDTCARPI